MEAAVKEMLFSRLVSILFLEQKKVNVLTLN